MSSSMYIYCSRCISSFLDVYYITHCLVRFLLEPGVEFTDLDLDEDELGGTVSWTPPPIADRVQVYQIFFSESAEGKRLWQLGGDLSRGA